MKTAFDQKFNIDDTYSGCIEKSANGLWENYGMGFLLGKLSQKGSLKYFFYC